MAIHIKLEDQTSDVTMIPKYMAGSMHMITTPCDWHEQASLLMPRNPDTQQREDSQRIICHMSTSLGPQLQ